jgi:hypothetical protein
MAMPLIPAPWWANAASWLAMMTSGRHGGCSAALLSRAALNAVLINIDPTRPGSGFSADQVGQLKAVADRALTAAEYRAWPRSGGPPPPPTPPRSSGRGPANQRSSLQPPGRRQQPSSEPALASNLGQFIKVGKPKKQRNKRPSNGNA